MNADAVNFARVVIPSPLKQPLIYNVPGQFREQIVVGMRVLIPLGKRKVTGVVFELLNATSLTTTRSIDAILDERPILDSSLIKISQWIGQYYVANLGEVLATLLPPTLRREIERTIVLKSPTVSLDDPSARKIVELLRQTNGKIGVKTLTRQVTGRNIYQALDRLEALGVIEIRERLPGQRRQSKRVSHDPDVSQSETEPRFTPSFEQAKALGSIEDRIKKTGFEVFLLHGVTGSGKTEVYLRAMEQVRRDGRHSLILIPEISLTPQLIDRLNARFPGRVGILHSALTASERWAQWWHILRGNVDVVVGARSAVFAPLPDLGLIIVDEEHDPSYKQDEGLRYNGRDIAVVRGKITGCPVILGSATPAIESYENCLQGRYRLLEMTQRVQQRPLPKVEAIDLRLEFRKSASNSDGLAAKEPKQKSAKPPRYEPRVISERLATALVENFAKSRQSLLFLNRRGFSNFLQCGLCGHVLRCSYCSVTLTLHRHQRTVCCHHCNFRLPATDHCPECGNPSLVGVGSGTEQIEQSLQEIVPGARVGRMDRDTTSQRGSHEKLIRAWQKGDLDILVGTQMITKGHDVAGVTLVGALLADLSLNLPDFRAAERTFQLLSQVAGRSGRGDDPGLVLIQTYAPDHYAIKHLMVHDYKSFFTEEIEFRRALNYPPFCHLVNLRIDGPKLDEVESKAKSLAKELRDSQAKNANFHEQIEILGPAPAPIAKLRNRYRWQLLVKGKQISSLMEFANHARALLPRSRNLRLHIDVDPYNML
jgi:primosomal protein N' (replication factor Y)